MIRCRGWIVIALVVGATSGCYDFEEARRFCEQEGRCRKAITENDDGGSMDAGTPEPDGGSMDAGNPEPDGGAGSDAGCGWESFNVAVHFRFVSMPQQSLNAVWSAEGDVWAAGTGSVILQFVGGSTTPIDHARGAANYWGISGSGKSDVWIVGTNSRVLHSDGGVPIILSPTTVPSISWGAWSPGPNEVFTAGHDGRIYRFTADGGSESFDTGAGQLGAIWGTSASDVWAVGESGAVRHFNNGVATTVDAGTSANLFGVGGTSSSDVWVVGANRTILHFDSAQWRSVDAGQSANALYGVWAGSPNDVWAVGPNQVLHWDGFCWKPLPGSWDAQVNGVYGDEGGVWITGGTTGELFRVTRQ